MSDGEYLTVESAAKVTGIPPRTLRRWVQDGKVTAIAGKRGKLVRVADLEQIAELTGRDVGQPVTAEESAGHAAERVAEIAPAINQQMSAIRDEWIRPFVDQIGNLSRELGRLEAENEALRKLVEEKSEAAKKADPQIIESPDPAIQESSPPRSWWKFWEK